MKRTLILLSAACALLIGVVTPCGAILINLDLYNSQALSNYNSTAALQGTTSGGDLIQIVLDGGDGIANALDSFGNPTGDDMLLSFGSTTNSWLHVGYGLPFNPNEGLLDIFPLQYSDSIVSNKIYVRFFDASTLGAATYYGNSSLFFLPAGTGPGFDQAAIDFAPTVSLFANQPLELTVIPEPSNLFLFGMMFWGVRTWRKRTKPTTI